MKYITSTEMAYDLTDYQGNSISIPPDKAAKIADVSGLIAVEVNGQTHYINPSNIASIKPNPNVRRTLDIDSMPTKMIERPRASFDSDGYKKFKAQKEKLMKKVVSGGND